MVTPNDIIAALTKKNSSRTPLSNDSVKMRIGVTHVYDVTLQQSCQNCGHKLDLPRQSVEFINGFSYDKGKPKKKEPEKQLPITATREGELEL